MPVRINTKFVLALIAAVVILFAALIGWYMLFLRTSPEENVLKAEQYLAQGDYERGVRYFGRAVHKARNNAEYRIRLAEIVEEAPVEDAATARDRVLLAINALREASEIRAEDPELLNDSYRHLFDLAVKQGLGRGYIERIAELTEVKLNGVPPGPVADVARRWRGIASLYQIDTDTTPTQRRQIYEDLAHALEVDPDDYLAAHHLARWNLAEAQRLEGLRADEQEVENLRGLASELSRNTVQDPPEDQRIERLGWHMILLAQPTLDRIEPLVEAIDALESHLLDTGEPRWLLPRVAQQLIDLDREPLEREGRGPLPRGVQRATRLAQAGAAAHPEDATLHALLGRLYRVQNRLDDALAAYRAAASVDPLAPPYMKVRNHALRSQARINAGDLLLIKARQAEDDETRQALLDEVQALVDDLRVVEEGTGPLNLLEGKLLLAQGQTAEALNLLVRADSQFNQSNPEAIRYVALASQQLGQWGNARRQIERLLELGRGNANLLLSLAEAMIRARDLDEAEAVLDRVTEAAPDNPRLAVLRARLAMARGDADQALSLLEGAGPEARALAGNMFIQLYAQAGRGDDARAAALERFERNPRNLTALRLAMATTDSTRERQALLDRARDAGASAPAIELLQQQLNRDEGVSVEEAAAMAINRIEDPVDRELTQARLDAARGDLDAARERIEAVLDDHADHGPAIELAFDLALQAEDLDAARRFADRARALELDHARGRFFAGRLAMAQGRYEQAAVSLQEGTRLRPVYSEGWALLGRAHLQAGEYASAAEAFERAVDQKPDNLDARARLGQAYHLLDEPARALATFERAWRMSPGNARLFDLYANYLAQRGELERVVELRREYAQQRPDDAGNRRSLALALAGDGQTDAAIDAARALIEDAGRTPENVVTLAQVQAAAGDPEAGLATLTGYVDGLGDDARARDHLLVARFLLGMNRLDRAVERYEMARAAQGEGSTEITRELADVLFQRGRMRDAIAVYRRVHEAEPEDDRVKLRLAEALIRVGDVDEAQAMLEGSGDVTSTVLEAMIASQRGDADQARSLLDQAVAQSPDHRQARMLRAQLLASQPGGSEQAVTDLTDLLADAPDDTRARTMLAELRLSRGEFDAAARQYQRILTDQPENTAARVRLVQALRLDGRVRRALEVAEAGLRQSPNEPAWHRAVAELAASLNDYGRAAEAWERTLALDAQPSDVLQYGQVLLAMNRPQRVLSLVDEYPSAVADSPRLQAVRARALHATGNPGGAEQVIQRALERSGDYPSLSFVANQAAVILGPSATIELLEALPGAGSAAAQATTGQLAMAGRQWGEAVGYFRAALDALGDDQAALRDQIHRQLATALHQAGEHREAAAWYEQALDATADNPQLLNNFAFLLANDLDDPQRALPYAERAAELAPGSATILDTLGWTQFQAGQPNAARQTLRRSIDLQPLAANHYHLGCVLADVGETGRARELLRRAVELARAAEDDEFLRKAEARLEALEADAAAMN